MIETKDLPNDERIFLKKDFLGWRVVEPITLDGKIVWKNVFSKKGLAMLIFILMIMGLSYLAFKEQINNYREVMSNPCSYCEDCRIMFNKGSDKIGNLNNVSLDTSTISQRYRSVSV